MATNEEIMGSLGEQRADIRNICQTLDKIQSYMGVQIEQHTNVIARMAVIEHVISETRVNMTNYTADCTKDRNDQDKRLANVEGYQGNQKKAAGAIAAFVAFLVYGGIKFLDKIFS